MGQNELQTGLDQRGKVTSLLAILVRCQAKVKSLEDTLLLVVVGRGMTPILFDHRIERTQ
ncbi:hypothetical protein CK224_30460 [Mesorhizobium sp. WSM3862]|nr:hypothetical protein CK224_30460 [Mesorhizobium sp. WSM3862]